MTTGSSAFENAERRFYESVGLEPAFRRIDLQRLGCAARVAEVGEGPPIVFVHGGVTSGMSWADLAAALPDFRCIMLDRPGCGLSDPLPDPPTTLAAKQGVGDDLLVDVADALELESTHVVSNSLGGWFAFRGLGAHPDRFDRVVAMGFQVGARIATAPWFMRVQSPAWVAKRIRVTDGMVRRMLSMAGMRGVIESGRFGDEHVTVMASLINHTDTMRNELMTAPPPMNLRGPVEATRHSAEMLGRVTAPTHLFWGTDDPFGGEDAAREFADCLPSATLEMAPGAGHAPWIDELDAAAAAVRKHFA